MVRFQHLALTSEEPSRRHVIVRTHDFCQNIGFWHDPFDIATYISLTNAQFLGEYSILIISLYLN